MRAAGSLCLWSALSIQYRRRACGVVPEGRQRSKNVALGAGSCAFVRRVRLWNLDGFCISPQYVLRLCHMSKTVTIRLTKDLASWLEQASKQSGIPKGRIVREQLEKAREGGKEPSFMRLAGSVRGARDLSSRRGFART
jgi:hypothetical protein